MTTTETEKVMEVAKMRKTINKCFIPWSEIKQHVRGDEEKETTSKNNIK